MSEAKHTPGPWEAEKFGAIHGGEDQQYFRGRRRSQVATACLAGNIHDDERDANARLIAAAPDLLEALKEVIALSDRKHEAWDKAKAAIAKAEGNS